MFKLLYKINSLFLVNITSGVPRANIDVDKAVNFRAYWYDIYTPSVQISNSSTNMSVVKKILATI